MLSKPVLAEMETHDEMLQQNDNATHKKRKEEKEQQRKLQVMSWLQRLLVGIETSMPDFINGQVLRDFDDSLNIVLALDATTSHVQLSLMHGHTDDEVG